MIQTVSTGFPIIFTFRWRFLDSFKGQFFDGFTLWFVCLVFFSLLQPFLFSFPFLFSNYLPLHNTSAILWIMIERRLLFHVAFIKRAQRPYYMIGERWAHVCSTNLNIIWHSCRSWSDYNKWFTCHVVEKYSDMWWKIHV